MPQPVDLQTEVARVSAADRVQQIADRVSLAAQQRQVLSVEQERVDVETQVQGTADTQNREVDADGRRRNPFVGRRQRRRKTGAQEPGEETPPAFYNAGEEVEEVADDLVEGRNFDVTI